MKFSTGFVVGAAVGGYLIYNMTPQQREKVADKAGTAVHKVRNSSLVGSLGSNLSGVAGAASDRVSGVVDSAGSAIADVVGPDDSSENSSENSSDGSSANGETYQITV